MKNPRTRPSTLDDPIIDMMPRIVMWWPSRPPAPIGYSKPPGIVPIPGTRKLERLEERTFTTTVTNPILKKFYENYQWTDQQS